MRPSRPQIAGAVVTAALVCALITPAQATTPVEDAGGHPRPSPQIVTPLVAGFPAAPQPALPGGTDWRERALAYDAFVYDWNPSGEGHPTILADTTHLNMDSDTYKIPVYYADTRIESDGYQEAVDQVASVVGATLVGVDKSDQDGHDYVSMLRTFFHPDLGIAMNNPLDRTDGGADTYWYTTTANVLYAMLGDQYPASPGMTESFRSIADRHYDMVVALGGAEADFTGQGFSFKTMTVNPGNRDEGGDAAAGTAAILLWAWETFGDERYLDGARWSMDYLDRSTTGLYYEILPVLAPYVAARLNAEAGTSYDPSRYVRWIEGGSTARPGWGTISGTWGGHDVHGLMGSQSDGGGYAFAMNSFAVGLLAPTARYDARYATLVGSWLHAVDHAARLFYPDQMDADHQSHGDRFLGAPEAVIPYEGLRAEEAGFSPRATGDPSRYGADWGLDPQTTDLGLYGGSWVGFLGGVVSQTDVDGVIRADLDATDFHDGDGYPTSLLYNSTPADATVHVTLDAPAQLFDAVTDTVVAPEASGVTAVQVPAAGSVVLVEAPVGGVLERTASATLIDSVPVAYVATTPPEPDPPVDVALGAPVTWSSDQNGNVGSHLTDGSSGTRWESEADDPQWFEIDLGAPFDLTSAVLAWEHASAKSYTIDVSTDGTDWSTVYTTTSGPGGRETLALSTEATQFLRFTGTERNTSYGYSAYSFAAYGVPSVAVTPEPTPSPTDETGGDPGPSTSPATPGAPGEPGEPEQPGGHAPSKGSTSPVGPPQGAGSGADGPPQPAKSLSTTGADVGPLAAGGVVVLLLGLAAVASARHRASR